MGSATNAHNLQSSYCISDNTSYHDLLHVVKFIFFGTAKLVNQGASHIPH